MSAGQPVTGGCLCGAVRYEIEGEPVFVGHSHCTHCQKSSGTGHLTAAGFPAERVRIKGKTASFDIAADSGATVTRQFCPTCGGRLFGASTGMPGLKLVMAGSLDDPDRVVPQMSVYGKRKRNWDVTDPSLPTFDAMPPRAG